MLTAAPRLKEIRLPEGDVLGFDVAGRNENGSRHYDPTWLAEGYDGVRFIGAGRTRTRIRPAAGIWTNLFVEQHPGIVRFESLAIHGRGRSAIMAGRDRPARVEPRFRLELVDFALIAEDPAPGAATSVMWGGFFYQVDTLLEDGDIHYGPATEHPFYHHGASGRGTVARRLVFHEAAAQPLKFRPDPSETLWAGPRVAYVIQDCNFLDWWRPTSSRGGCAICVEGGSGDLRVERCEFVAPTRSALHARTIMVDDGGPAFDSGQLVGGKFYDAVTGRAGVGFANGHVLIRDCGLRAGPGQENLTPVIRVGSLGSGQRVARSVTIERSAIYGQRLQLQLSDIPPGKTTVRGCNTPAIRGIAASRGYDVAHEALIPLSDRVIPVSAGLAR